ncbi:MAG TPA: TNT domain-containing protein, partial [Ilumatobacteraceae bacterium]|nr:TNT domain-containing protein [Ilumatobacteraceae bacterium]
LAPAWAAADAKPAKRTTCSTVDYQKDARLGPKRLPNAGPLATVLAGYDRLAGMTAKRYLRTYYDSAAKTWRYPPQGGYQLTPDDRPVKMQLSLFAGQRIDRFGSEFGGYLSPEGTPYEARGIPPQSLDSTTAPATCNYSRYKVLQTIPVYSGPIAPALGQPGFGLQYVLDASIFPGSPPDLNVGYLVANGYLQRVATGSRATVRRTGR